METLVKNALTNILRKIDNVSLKPYEAVQLSSAFKNIAGSLPENFRMGKDSVFKKEEDVFEKEEGGAKTMTNSEGIKKIKEERIKHFTQFNWTTAHDDKWDDGELSQAAACYAQPERLRRYNNMFNKPLTWPWGERWWRPDPTDRINELKKAGALIAAEIDRLGRLNKNQDRKIDG